MEALQVNFDRRLGFKPIISEARHQPRVIVNLPMQIRLDDGQFFNAIVHDVSPDALQIRCDQKTAQLLSPLDNASSSPHTAHIRLHLPFNAGSLSLSADCEIIHQSACDHEQVAFGLRFVEFSGVGARILKIFIEASMKRSAFM